MHFSVSFTEVVRRSQTDPALIAALASVPIGFKNQKIPVSSVSQFAELGSRLLDAIEANSSANTCKQLAEAAAVCSLLGNSEGEASSRASVIAVEATKSKGKKSRSSTGFVDKHALLRSSALFRYFDIRESNVAQAASAVSQGDTEDEATKFCAVEVLFMHAMWSRSAGDSTTGHRSCVCFDGELLLPCRRSVVLRPHLRLPQLCRSSQRDGRCYQPESLLYRRQPR